MERRDGVALVLNYRAGNTYALNAVVGALEMSSLLEQVEVRFAESQAELASQIAQAGRDGRQVVVGWSFFSPDFPKNCSELLRLRKRIRAANVIHLAGVVHATVEPEQTLRAGFDFVAVGEGERTILHFLERTLAGADPKDTPGIASLRNGRCCSNTWPTTTSPSAVNRARIASLNRVIAGIRFRPLSRR